MNARRKPAQMFRREWLPAPEAYYTAAGLNLVGRGEWRSARCEFHDDTHPSMRINMASGGFRCFVCGAHGGDVLAYEMLRHDLPFRRAAERLGAWG